MGRGSQRTKRFRPLDWGVALLIGVSRVLPSWSGRCEATSSRTVLKYVHLQRVRRRLVHLRTHRVINSVIRVLCQRTLSLSFSLSLARARASCSRHSYGVDPCLFYSSSACRSTIFRTALASRSCCCVNLILRVSTLIDAPCVDVANVGVNRTQTSAKYPRSPIFWKSAFFPTKLF